MNNDLRICTRCVSDTTTVNITFYKKGFSNSRDKWFRTYNFKNFLFELINSDSFRNRGYFDSDIANKQYKTNQFNNYKFYNYHI